VFALATVGSTEEAVDATDGLIDAAESTDNPYILSLALGACGLALADADPVRALNALRRGVAIAQDSANRFSESILAIPLSRAEADHGDLRAGLDYVTLAIRNCHDSGNVAIIRNPLAVLAGFLDRPRPLESSRRLPTFATSSATSSVRRSPKTARR
jgi:hypothetical protein